MRTFFRTNSLLCFSPPVMVATMVIELCLAAWIISKYVMQTPTRLVVALLVLLAGFQFAEYNVCTVTGTSMLWPRLGYDFITFLPPVGIHLAMKLRNDSRPGLLYVSYGLAVVFAATFSFSPSGLGSGVCAGNYVILHLQPVLSKAYGTYYFALELVGVALSLFPPAKLKAKARQSLRWLGVGYLSMMLPTFFIYLLQPTVKNGIPSIMCGFAVTLAIIVATRVTPLFAKERRSSRFKFNMPRFGA